MLITLKKTELLEFNSRFNAKFHFTNEIRT